MPSGAFIGPGTLEKSLRERIPGGSGQLEDEHPLWDISLGELFW